MKNKNILGFLTLFLIPFVSAASKGLDIQKVLNDILTTPVKLLNSGGVQLWIFLCTLFFLYIIFFLLLQRVPFIAANRAAMVILSLIFSFVGVTTTGVGVVFVSLIGYSMVLFFIVAFLFLASLAWLGFVKGPHKNVAEVAQQHADQSMEIMRAGDDLRKEKSYYKKENVLYSQEIRDFEGISKRIKNLPNIRDPSYSPNKDSINRELDDAMTRVRRTINMDMQKLRIRTSDPREVKMRKVDQDIMQRVSEAKSRLNQGNASRAKSEVDRIVGLLKKQRGLLKNWFKHENLDFNNMQGNPRP